MAVEGDDGVMTVGEGGRSRDHVMGIVLGKVLV